MIRASAKLVADETSQKEGRFRWKGEQSRLSASSSIPGSDKRYVRRDDAGRFKEDQSQNRGKAGPGWSGRSKETLTQHWHRSTQASMKIASYNMNGVNGDCPSYSDGSTSLSPTSSVRKS
jgi:hypothetical protein